jgi:hypothetical protein
MPFSVDDFHDLIRLLEAQPEWRAELRRLLLTDELLAIPEHIVELRSDIDRRFQALIEAQQRTAARLTALAEAQQRTEARLMALAEAQQHTAARLTALVEAQERTTAQVAELTMTVRTLTVDVGELKGDSLERRYRERAVAYFGRLLRRVRILSLEDLAVLLDEAVERGALSEAEAQSVTWTDLVVQGRRRQDGTEATLVVEVSWGVGPQDVERAAARAALLTRAGLAALPVVAGRSITAEAVELARQRQVWQVLDGQVMSPPPTS